MANEASTPDLAAMADEISLITIKPTSFMDVSTELRLKIYRLAFSHIVDEFTTPCLPKEQDKKSHTSPYGSVLALLHTNRTIRLEVHATLLPLVSAEHYAASSSLMHAAVIFKRDQDAKASFKRRHPALAALLALEGVDPEEEEELNGKQRQLAEAELRFREMEKIRSMIMRVDEWLNRAG